MPVTKLDEPIETKDGFVITGIINYPADEGGGFAGYSGHYSERLPLGFYIFIIFLVLLCAGTIGMLIGFNCFEGACRDLTPTATAVYQLIP